MSESAAPFARPSALQAWWLAARPRTLPLAAAPVAVGSAVAFGAGGGRAGPAVAALAGALLLQIGANFANDVYDAEKGADTASRIGPPRATQLGWLSAVAVKRGMWLSFALAAIVGVYLIAAAGWVVLWVGLASIAAAIAYTGGPWPFGYHGLGDLMVFLFFGVVAVCGTTYVQTHAFELHALAASLPVGALATAVLVVNNLRDREGDARAGKRTLAVRFGARATQLEYRALVFGAYAALVLCVSLRGSLWLALPALTLPESIRLVRGLASAAEGPEFNALLAATARLGLVFSLLLAAGWLGAGT